MGQGRRAATRCSALERCSKALESRAHGLAIAPRSILDARDRLDLFQCGFRSEIVIPFSDSASGLGRFDAVAPGGEVKTLAGALKRKGTSRLCLNDRALRGPGVLTIAVVTIEGSPDNRPIETFMPLTGVTFFGPFTHASHIGDSRVYLLGGRRDVTRDLKSWSHGG